MGTLTTRVVNRLSAPLSSSTAPYTKAGVAYDWAIGGLPFFSAVNPERPLERRTAPVRKDQIDQGTDPGEQSLVFWWLRSQSSFHGGAGVKYQESSTQDIYSQFVQYRFNDTRGLDVFSTKGQATLLPDCTSLKAAGASSVIVHGCVDSAGPTDIVLQAEGASLYRVLADGSSSSVSWGGVGTILSICDDGTNYYVLDDAGIWKGTLAGGAGTKIYVAASTTSGVLGWVKQRLMAGINNAVYELDANAAGGSALPTAKYTAKNPTWVWTAITDTPPAILIAGYAGTQSEIFEFTLDTSGVVPTLTGAISATTLPEGENVYSIYSYLGDYVAIGTAKGVRIAQVDQNSGTLQYGPVVFATTNPVRGFVGRDRFIYCGVTDDIDGNSGLYVIDLSMQTDFRRYAYSTHLLPGVTGTLTSVALLGSSGRLVMGIGGQGSYVQHATNLVASGWLQTGNIRFHTIENKLFKFVRVRGDAHQGSLAVTETDPSGNSTPIATFSATASLDEAALNVGTGPVEYISLKFTLTRDAGLTTGPTLTGWQVKALPAQKRQRLMVIPLLCFDQEVDKHGKRVGRTGTAIARLQALEALEEAADIVLLQDLNQDPAESRLVVIDDLDFKQIDPPGKFSGWGGVVFVTARTVT